MSIAGYGLGSMARFLPPKGKAYLAGCLLAVLVVFAIAFLAKSQTLEFRLSERGRYTEATVVAITQNAGNTPIAPGFSIPDPTAVRVRYQTPAGEVTADVNLANSNQTVLGVGDGIHMVYDPEHPAQCLPADEVSPSPGTTPNVIPVFWEVWAGFVALASFGLFYNLRKARRERGDSRGDLDLDAA
jgi:hypothetical protein